MPKSSPSDNNKDYYQAIIQIRPKNQEILEFIKNSLPKDSMMISKIIEKSFGFDLYVRDRKFATSVSRRVNKTFKTQIKISKALHSQDRQTSKLLYRLTVLIKSDK